MSMNKDLVAQAVAAIPLWMAFLDQKEAEQDALLSQMQGTKKTGFMEKATSLLKKKKDKNEVPSAASSSPSALDSDEPGAISLKKPSTDNPHPKDKDDIRWAPIEEGTTTEIVDEESEKEENQFQNMF